MERWGGEYRRGLPRLTITQSTFLRFLPCLKKLTEKVSYSRRPFVRFTLNQHSTTEAGSR